MIRWETLLKKFQNLFEPSASPEDIKIFKYLFKSTKKECNDLIKMSKVMEKEIEKLENKLMHQQSS